jgi:hypothetical protein
MGELGPLVIIIWPALAFLAICMLVANKIGASVDWAVRKSGRKEN